MDWEIEVDLGGSTVGVVATTPTVEVVPENPTITADLGAQQGPSGEIALADHVAAADPHPQYLLSVADFKLRALTGFYPNGEQKEFQNVDGSTERFEWWDRTIGASGAIKLLTAALSYGSDGLASQVLYTDWRRLANGASDARISKTITWPGGLNVKVAVVP